VAAIVVATLRPSGSTLPAGWSFYLAAGDEAVAEFLQNIILFIPLGLALALGRTGTAPWRLIAAGALLSFAIEFAQQWIPGRDPSLGDIVANTAGTAVGVLVMRTAPLWLAPPPPPSRAAWRSLGCALAAATVWLATGWLLRPMLPTADAIERWTPDLGSYMDLYSGKVLSVTGRLGVKEPLRIVAVAGPPSGRLAPLLDVDEGPWPAGTLVSADRGDLVLRNRSQSMYLKLDRPDLRARGTLARVAPGDTFTVTAWTDGAGYCLARDADRWCGLGYTMGDGWKLIFYPDHFPPAALQVLNALWIAGWSLGVGWWARRHAASGLALAVVAVTLLAGPGLVGLLATPIGEIVGGVGGIGGGLLAWRWYGAPTHFPASAPGSTSPPAPP
jgi:VanZ like family